MTYPVAVLDEKVLAECLLVALDGESTLAFFLEATNIRSNFRHRHPWRKSFVLLGFDFLTAEGVKKSLMVRLGHDCKLPIKISTFTIGTLPVSVEVYPRLFTFGWFRRFFFSAWIQEEFSFEIVLLCHEGDGKLSVDGRDFKSTVEKLTGRCIS